MDYGFWDGIRIIHWVKSQPVRKPHHTRRWKYFQIFYLRIRVFSLFGDEECVCLSRSLDVIFDFLLSQYANSLMQSISDMLSISLSPNVPQVPFCLVKYHTNQANGFSAVPILVGVAFGTNLLDGGMESFLNRPVFLQHLEFEDKHLTVMHHHHVRAAMA